LLPRLAWLVLVATPLPAEKLELDLVKADVVQKRLTDGLVPLKERQAAITSLFQEAGCAPVEQGVDKKSANVICTLPGETAATIVVGGHFDFAKESKGIVDDWSGASLLPSLYQALQSRPHRHTYVFIAFASEETGLDGSRYYVRHLSADQKSGLRAFINLECLGMTTPKVWLSRATPALVSRLMEIAGAVHIPLQGVNVDNVGNDDSQSFLAAKLPVITIHSVTQQTLSTLHSYKDRMDAIRQDVYYDTYRLMAFYLEYLDKKTE
jgi:Zn-dependent M28 family amino/carboxypeptidase